MDLAQQMKNVIDSALFGGRAGGGETAVSPAYFEPTEPTAPGGVDTNSLVRAYEELKKLPPIVNEIWFVDRVDMYYQFLGFFSKADKPRQTCFDITLTLWTTDCFDPETEIIAEPDDTSITDILKRGRLEKLVYPWICKHPGMWLHLSNGRWVQYQDDAAPASPFAVLKMYRYVEAGNA